MVLLSIGVLAPVAHCLHLVDYPADEPRQRVTGGAAQEAEEAQDDDAVRQRAECQVFHVYHHSFQKGRQAVCPPPASV